MVQLPDQKFHHRLFVLLSLSFSIPTELLTRSQFCSRSEAFHRPIAFRRKTNAACRKKNLKFFIVCKKNSVGNKCQKYSFLSSNNELFSINVSFVANQCVQKLFLEVRELKCAQKNSYLLFLHFCLFSLII